MATVRIGHGYDVHAFESGDHLMMGGVRIPFEQQFKAHSDGDVLLHAVCDALLGALALGDIGQHFPDTDIAFKDADSRDLLRQVYQKVSGLGYELGNLDVTVIAQAPRMSPHLKAIRENLAQDLQTEINHINVKATTTEKLGFTGRKEGIAVHAVCLVEKNS